MVGSSREMDDDTVIADGAQQDTMSVVEDFDLVSLRMVCILNLC